MHIAFVGAKAALVEVGQDLVLKECAIGQRVLYSHRGHIAVFLDVLHASLSEELDDRLGAIIKDGIEVPSLPVAR